MAYIGPQPLIAGLINLGKSGTEAIGYIDESG